MLIYMVSDNNIGAILVSLGITGKCIHDKFYYGNYTEYSCPGYPEFASNIIWELYSKESTEGNGSKTWYFKFKYNDKFYDICDSDSLTCDY